MKLHFFPAAAIILATVFSPGCNQQNTGSTNATTAIAPATVEELGQMNRDFAKALTAHDATAAAILYDENASLLPPNEKIITGRANIQQYWQGAIDAGIIDASVKTIDAKSDGRLGYEIGTFMLRFKGPNGDTIIDKGKFTEILRLDSMSGKWISTYGMWSNDEPAH